MSKESLVTALVTKWKDEQRPYRAEIRVDGHCVRKSFHVTIIEAFIWAEEAKAAKLKEMGGAN